MTTDGMRGVVSFVTTVSAGSFAAAARELGISPVAVSKNVGRLERELGIRLLQRSTRKLGVTEEGRLFYERCAGPLRDLESARSAARERASAVTGTVRVTGVTPFTMTYVLPLIPAFTRTYPNVEVELHLDDNVSDMIAQGYDVGIRVGRISKRRSSRGDIRSALRDLRLSRLSGEPSAAVDARPISSRTIAFASVIAPRAA